MSSKAQLSGGPRDEAFEQYDSIVGSRTVHRPEGADAAVPTVPERLKRNLRVVELFFYP